ncbi:probable calcium-binding protein CML35 [Lycium barbarum]|uniref:probable calcium-binding protein CML35 n=1 Tax=Lycium barbarum TaxID=112863 RepID=UPI00293EC33C|nr:probable calcium-binding protein CML35 [Lycium barbarum]
MKLIKNIPNKIKLFKSKKTRSISRSENPSFGSSITTSSSSSNILSTPTSVLPTTQYQIQAFDNDGKIRKEELEAILTRVGSEPPSEEEVILLLNEVDLNGDAFGSPLCDGDLRDAFDFFDVDHDGKITAEELFNVFTMIGDSRCTLEDCKRMIRGVDKNGDGFVCFEDFSLMMEHQR